MTSLVISAMTTATNSNNNVKEAGDKGKKRIKFHVKGELTTHLFGLILVVM